MNGKPKKSVGRLEGGGRVAGWINYQAETWEGRFGWHSPEYEKNRRGGKDDRNGSHRESEHP